MKSVVISGGGSGLGKELGVLLSKKGMQAILLGRTEKKLLETSEIIKKNGGEASYYVLDITAHAEVKKTVCEINENHDVEMLINNAGVGYFGPILESTDQQLLEMFQTNVFGSIYLTKSFLPMFLKNSTGTILNIISTAGLRGKKNEALYVSSKFALRGFSESLQKEYEGDALKIVNAYMGGMDTPFWDESDHITDKSRMRTPKDVAEMILKELPMKDKIVIESKK
ncbi:short-subunit dehydrogenase [Bacillus pakistanensis]|uniref:Short-subunit dehydrogenase n=1 Tax=Rossellomorea pakistanensis TaxID=992288 RepID=A0ABS2NGZ2_9BACI|nr:SDR family oxidoreductase [Bacillus pakistanensis]MBM7587099.1 short-subunit dehydrogenase [Bacillus pakistanensis]